MLYNFNFQQLSKSVVGFQPFLDYMTTTWIDDDCLFPIELWNQWSNIDRTNNNNEAYNLRLENRIGRPHPHIWSFIEVIQKEETLVAIKYHRIEAGILKSRGRNKTDIKRDLKLHLIFVIFNTFTNTFKIWIICKFIFKISFRN